MSLRILTILGLLSAVAFTGAAAQETTQPMGVQEKLGPDYQFLLNEEPPGGGKVSPGDALILRSLCGAGPCAKDPNPSWDTAVVPGNDGQDQLTLADFLRFHREDGRGWGEIVQTELGVKLGTLMRETASGRDFSTVPPGVGQETTTPSSTSSKGAGGETAAGIVTGSGRAVQAPGLSKRDETTSETTTGVGSASGKQSVGQGRGQSEDGIVTGTGQALGTLGRSSTGTDKGTAAGIVTGSGRALGLSGMQPGKDSGIVTGTGQGIGGPGAAGSLSSSHGRGHTK